MAVSHHDVRSIADIPCGDFNWMPLFLEAAPFVGYQGFDIVPDIIKDNRKRHPVHSFEELDITREVPPRTDLIFCKDLLNHLSNADVRAALENMRRSGARLLLASNNFGYANLDLPSVATKTSRHLDITPPPLNAPPPVWKTNYLGLWRLADFPEIATGPFRG
jgi:NAD(P)-dependent dehydrogenase (short-subunit alcohol dehydrogenase family)